jgi:hypothetical protein
MISFLLNVSNNVQRWVRKKKWRDFKLIQKGTIMSSTVIALYSTAKLKDVLVISLEYDRSRFLITTGENTKRSSLMVYPHWAKLLMTHESKKRESTQRPFLHVIRIPNRSTWWRNGLSRSWIRTRGSRLNLSGLREACTLMLHVPCLQPYLKECTRARSYEWS